jgi:ribosomal protein S18 acetylase RimI-like enzyme
MTSTDVTFRPATASDAAVLASFGERVFRDTFGPDNTAADMSAYCDAAFAVERVQRELGDPGRYTVLAHLHGELAGYAQLRASSPPAFVTGDAPIELLRFYVDHRWHGRGVAQALMARVLAAASGRGAQTIYLSVWERNHRAAAFYAKHGFAKIGSAPFLLGTRRDTDDVMARSVAVD